MDECILLMFISCTLGRVDRKHMDGSFGSYYGDLHQYVILSLGILYGITESLRNADTHTVAGPCNAVIERFSHESNISQNASFMFISCTLGRVDRKHMDGSFGSYYGDLHQYVILSLGILYGITESLRDADTHTVVGPCNAVI
ncbi:hypothetical protein ACOME3_000177 [Neoechinorhynchus agilis]